MKTQKILVIGVVLVLIAMIIIVLIPRFDRSDINSDNKP